MQYRSFDLFVFFLGPVSTCCCFWVWWAGGGSLSLGFFRSKLNSFCRERRAPRAHTHLFHLCSCLFPGYKLHVLVAVLVAAVSLVERCVLFFGLNHNNQIVREINLPHSSSFVLIGHSTGCQDSVFYMQHGRPDLKAKVLGVVLQVCRHVKHYR